MSTDIGIFINIDSINTYAELVPEDIRGRVTCFAVALTDDAARVIERSS
jgi:hypothetical protein